MRLTFFLTSMLLLVAVGAWGQQDNYGAARANTRNMPAQPVIGGRTDFNYLALKDHPAKSGVPLGGIGVGNVQFAPDGRFVRIGLNNIHMPIPVSKQGFFALWYRQGTKTGAHRLVRDSVERLGMPGVQHTSYKGLFPVAALEPTLDNVPVKATIRAWSSLVPHNIKESSLPLVWFEVELFADNETDAAVAFSWEDFIGRGIKDPVSVEGMDGQALSRSELVNGEEWPEMPRIKTLAASYAAGRYKGVRQYAERPITPNKATFQNYVQEVAVLGLETPGTSLSVLNAYDENDVKNWSSFVKTGAFPSGARSAVILSDHSGEVAASAIALKTHLAKGQRKVLRFALAWYFPELVINRENAVPGSFWAGGSDYGRYFHRYFTNLSSLLAYGDAHYGEMYQKTMEWQRPILASTMPDWLKFKTINSAYVIYTNMILNKKGDVTVNEGGMGGLAGTMDQRISSHPFYQKFFTQLDRSEMEIFGDAQAFDGSINHFIGHYYVGMGTVGGRVPTENHWMLDNTEGWIIQVVKDYEQTGDLQYLRRFAGRMKDGMKFLRSRMPAGVDIPVGPTTYDDFTHPPIYSYGAGMYLASLKAAKAAAEALKDTSWAAELQTQFERSKPQILKRLWNGRFFSYGAEIDGSGRLDSILFTGQLAGSFISRYSGWGDVIPLPYVRASLISQFKISLSKTPDYYANKVWDIRLGHGIDQRGSQCWPFYLESYTAYPALQAGFVEDGLDIMKHIQLVHLRKGLTWSQNLWNPGNITYMTAPVTWFSTDVLAGAGVNLPKGALRLGPLLKDSGLISYPLYFPTFWARFVVDNTQKTARLDITKTFGEQKAVFKTLIIEPPGIATETHKVISLSPFVVTAGKSLDLSAWYSELSAGSFSSAVLPRADSIPFEDVP